MAIIAFFTFLLMLTMGGISIDLMRHEMERTEIQTVLDGAVLAGAGAPAGATDEEIKTIVEDFFVKSGKGDYLNDLSDDDIIATLNSRRVRATADVTLNTYLMKLMGVNTLTAAGGATAEVRTPKLEVSLVLDVSGSMSGAKLANLKVAAKEFVTTLITTSDPGATVISIVPFSWTTSPGQPIYNAMIGNIDDTHDFSNCLRFEAADYQQSYIDPILDPLAGPKYQQQIYTSVYGGFDNFHSSGWRSCFRDDYAEIMAFSMSEQALHDRIDLLSAGGNTSGHIGMKWGAALLDPTFQPVATSLIAQGVVDASLTNVPALYTEPDTKKIIVMMGDGANTSSYYFDQNGPYRGPNSDLYELVSQDMALDNGSYVPSGPAETLFYLRDDENYYSIDEDIWLNQAEFDARVNAGDGNPLLEVTDRRLDWEEAWGYMTPEYYGDITGDYGPWNDYVGSEAESGSIKNTHMSNICTSTKGQGVTVYTIGFEVPENGTAETKLRNCASSTLNYYAASGVNISDAFGSIASNLQSLRLTQ